MKRPAHALDCPACDGWLLAAALLCPRCTARVQTFAPDLFASCLARCGAAAWPEFHYLRGVIAGAAMVLNGRPKA